jgi:hypothetical protein
MKYYLTNIHDDDISNLLKSNHLFSDESSNYVKFSLLGSISTLPLNKIILFFDTDVLTKRSFRYALRLKPELYETTKVKELNVDDVLFAIDNENILKQSQDSHCILLRDKINLKYLVAIYYDEFNKINKSILEQIKKLYPNVLILDKMPLNAKELTDLIIKLVL